MKYKELHKLLKQHGCYELNRQIAGHPAWHSPITGRDFPTSNHGTAEVPRGTLKSILRQAGIE